MGKTAGYCRALSATSPFSNATILLLQSAARAIKMKHGFKQAGQLVLLQPINHIAIYS